MRRLGLSLALCTMAATPGLPVLAQSFSVPDGCTPQFTVQYQSCLMMNLWTCEADAPGEKWMMLFGQNGPVRLRKVDSDFQWLETYYTDGSTETMMTPAPDPSDMAELLSTKRDTYDFSVDEPEGERRYRGYDALTGEEPVIDGERLLATEYAYEQFDETGNQIGGSKGAQFVHPEFRIFLFGQSTDLDGSNPWSALPRNFYRPGDKGFFPNLPIYDCGVVTSQFDNPSHKETRHDQL
ncbi:MAG: hypothetical protein AAGD04_01260 [Pseudomonadota bacterium]